MGGRHRTGYHMPTLYEILAARPWSLESMEQIAEARARAARVGRRIEEYLGQKPVYNMPWPWRDY